MSDQHEAQHDQRRAEGAGYDGRPPNDSTTYLWFQKVWQLLVSLGTIVALALSMQARLLAVEAKDVAQDKWISDHEEYTKVRAQVLDDVKTLVTRIDERIAALDKAGEARDVMLRHIAERQGLISGGN